MEDITTTNKLLILDDDRLVTKTLELLLKTSTDYDIYPFNSPLDALEFIKSVSSFVSIFDNAFI